MATAPSLLAPTGLTAVQFQALADIPLESAWFANLTNANTHRPVKNNRTRTLVKPLHPAVYQDIVQPYAKEIGLTEAIPGLCMHSLHATAATHALSHNADVATA